MRARFQQEPPLVVGGESEIVETTSMAGSPKACGVTNDDWRGLGEFLLFREVSPYLVSGRLSIDWAR